MSEPAATAEPFPPLKQADVERRIMADMEKFPALLPVVLKGLAIIEGGGGSSAQLERILQADAVMVARILRLANSAYFGVMTEVRTVSMAVNIIGYRKLGSLLRHILVAGLVELLSQRRPGAVKIRETALAASAASHELATLCEFEDPEELLVAGHVFNIGELALLWSFPREYESLLAREQGRPLDRAQEAAFGTNSRQIGRLVLSRWHFPNVLCQAVEHWSDPLSEAEDAALRQFLAIVHAGVAVAEAWALQAEPESLEVSPEILAELPLEAEMLPRVLANLPRKIEAVRAVLSD